METEMEADNLPPSEASVQLPDSTNLSDGAQIGNSSATAGGATEGGATEGGVQETEGNANARQNKRPKTSGVWRDMEEVIVSGVKKAKCKHCPKILTSNLFLNEVLMIKENLDAQSEDEDAFISSMAEKMKAKFDKYWGECNLLMSVAAVLDPRCKMTVIDYAFPMLYSESEARENIKMVNDALHELYNEYLEEHQKEVGSTQAIQGECTTNVSQESRSSSGWSRFYEYAKARENVPAEKSDLVRYMEAGIHIHAGDPSSFDVLAWWKSEASTYRILSKMARDILAIPITTVASEATFSAGSRVIDTYRASLAPQTVQELLCAGDWLRSFYGVKKKNKKEKKPQEIVLPI